MILQPWTKFLRQICPFSDIDALIPTPTPLPTPIQCCFAHDACPYKSCGLQNNIERGEGEDRYLCSSLRGLIKNNRKIRLCFQFVSSRGCLQVAGMYF